MLLRLSLTGLQRRFKDYAVLFSGLVIASMIFYMFMSISANPGFYKANVSMGARLLPFIFGFGNVLLAIVTFFYLIYANSFMLSMRQHDYGMFLTLGAKRGKISILVVMETLVTGLAATLVGIGLGIGLTGVVSQLLLKQLHLDLTHLNALVPAAIGYTLLFFIVVSLLAGLWNVQKLLRTKLIDLLHEKQKPVKLIKHPVLRSLEGISGLVILAWAYYTMMHFKVEGAKVEFTIAFFGTLIGSWLLFNAFFSTLIGWIMNKHGFTYKGLRLFTLGQLKFRLNDFTQILTITSVLFGLALGAVTVGQNFRSEQQAATKSTYYSLVIAHPTNKIKQKLAKLDHAKVTTYHYKLDAKGTIYFNRKEFAQKRLYTVEFHPKSRTYSYLKMPLDQVYRMEGDSTLILGAVSNSQVRQQKMVKAAAYKRVKGQTATFLLVRDTDLAKDYQKLKQIDQMQPQTENVQAVNSLMGVSTYEMIIDLIGSFEFMGFFLGLAFLAMLASTLMFKVLSQATNDRPRYQMLFKLGAQSRSLKRSIAWELGILFVLPGLVGAVDVLFGLGMFKSMFQNPWYGIWLPFVIFAVLYLLYYLLTIKLYQKLVLRDYQTD